MGKVMKLEQPKEVSLVLDRKAVLAAIPTNWLDDILTGPNKVIADGYVFTPKDIEKALLAVKARIEGLRTMEPCDCCKAIVWSDQDACSNCG